MQIRNISSFILALIATSSFALAQEIPNSSQLKNRLENSLPEYWVISEFRLIAESDIGDAVKPQRAVRFEADIHPKSTLYSAVASEGPYQIISPTYETESSRTLYGVMKLSYSAGNWSGNTVFDNPVDELGIPRDLFNRPTLELNSKKTEEVIKGMRDQILEGKATRFEKMAASLKERHVARISRIKNDHIAKIQEIEGDQTREIQKLIQSHKTEIERKTREYEKELADLTENMEPKLAVARAAHEKEISILQRQHEKEIESLKRQYAEKRGRIVEEQQERISALETRLESAQQNLKAKIDSSTQIANLQEELSSKLNKQGQTTIQLTKELENIRRQRRQYFASFPKAWSGDMHCKNANGNLVDKHLPFFLTIETVTSNGARAVYTNRSGSTRGVDVNMTLVEDEILFPMQVRLVRDDHRRYNHIPKLMNAIINKNGTIVGDGNVTWNVNDQSVPIECHIEVAS